MNPCILVVEDNIGILRLMGAMLSTSNLSVIEASSADVALDLLETTTPDLIIADIMMPGMNGIELCHAIRAREETAETPIIILSAHTDMEVVKQSLQAGASHFLTKPIRRDALLSTVQRVLDGSA